MRNYIRRWMVWRIEGVRHSLPRSGLVHCWYSNVLRLKARFENLFRKQGVSGNFMTEFAFDQTVEKSKGWLQIPVLCVSYSVLIYLNRLASNEVRPCFRQSIGQNDQNFYHRSFQHHRESSMQEAPGSMCDSLYTGNSCLYGGMAHRSSCRILDFL